MHFVTCEIRLSGSLLNVVHRNAFRPVSWPELEVLRFLHGEDAVINAKPFVRIEQNAKAEKERLRLIYGSDVLETVFPGRNPQMEMEAPGAKLPAETPPWKSPIDVDPALYDKAPEERRAEPATEKPKRNYAPI